MALNGFKKFARAVGLGVVLSQTAHAGMNASLSLGGSILSGAVISNATSISTLVGAELTYDLLTYFEAGAFYDHNFLGYSDMTSGSLRFYGAVVRVGLLGHSSNLFMDSKIGLSQRTTPLASSDQSLGLGVGIGYHLWITPFLSFSPRLGARILPETFGGPTASKNTADGNLLLTFNF